MKSHRLAAAIACAAMHATPLAAAEVAALPLGIAESKPAEGPAVPVDGGYMVAYTETIPGTDVTFEMEPIPGGEFLLGSPANEPGRADDEGPQVRISVEPMWVGRCEVTWAEYRTYMAAYEQFKQLERVANAAGSEAAGADDPQLALVRRHTLPVDAEGEEAVDAVTCPTPLYEPSYTYTAGEEPNQPAVTMTPFAARQYTKWLSGVTGREYRLPTESEWEYAVRAGTSTAYYFGDDPEQLSRHAWFEDNADWETHPVGAKTPNPWGLYDMLGNVAEWTLDQYDADHYAQLAVLNESSPVPAADAVLWPTKVSPRSVRGGSWLAAADRCRSAARHASEDEEWKLSDPNLPLSPWWYTEEPAMGVGMRVVRPLAGIPAGQRERVWDAEVEDVADDVRARLQEGRGARGVATPMLPEAIKAAEALSE